MSCNCTGNCKRTGSCSGGVATNSPFNNPFGLDMNGNPIPSSYTWTTWDPNKQKEWQKCPVCEGSGMYYTSNPFGLGVGSTLIPTRYTHPCHACSGKGMVVRPE